MYVINSTPTRIQYTWKKKSQTALATPRTSDFITSLTTLKDVAEVLYRVKSETTETYCNSEDFTETYFTHNQDNFLSLRKENSNELVA